MAIALMALKQADRAAEGAAGRLDANGKKNGTPNSRRSWPGSAPTRAAADGDGDHRHRP